MFHNDSLINEKQKKETFENRIIYSLPVRLGLWNESLAIEEYKNSVISYKQEHGELLIMKIRKMMRNITKPVALAYDKSFVKYGDHYQIKIEILEELKSAANFNELFLSGLINEKEIEDIQNFKHGCQLVASPLNTPCIRNSFKIISCNRNKKEGEPVHCGEDIFIQILNSETNHQPLYVNCPNLTVGTFGKIRKLHLSVLPDFYCRFKIYHWNPEYRMITTGASFAPNTKVIIQHSASGQNLAAEFNQCIPTFFGKEWLVSCRTYRDTHKMETAENFWIFVCHSGEQ